jgi:hypothetical protein
MAVSRIKPQELVIGDVEGLDTTALREAGGTGLRVVVGRNNAGKTRLLRALLEARFRAAVRPGEHKRARNFEHAMLHAAWESFGPITLTWPRDLQAPPASFLPGQVPSAIEVDAASFDQATESKPGLRDANIVRMVAGELWSHLERRPAVLVSTDRYFGQEAPLDRTVNLAEPALWAATLTKIANSAEPADRKAWARIHDPFREITDGLVLHGRISQGGAAIVQVEDNGRERQLNACGDGLRDVAGILLFAAINPGSDLMLDEPGLRLHPHTQRALLRYLEGEARERAVWIASHDGAFIGAPAVKRRFEVHRDSAADTSSVTELASPERARTALLDLGWLPGDAFLADRVLLCEGESDRAALDVVREWLVKDDISWSGMRVSPIFGSGSVWKHDRKDLEERLRLAREIAPHAAHAVLVDRDTSSNREVETLEKRLATLGLRLVVLPVRELENLWLEPGVVHHVLAGLAAAASEIRGEKVAAPSLAQVKERLKKHDLEKEKGSEVIEQLCGPALRFDKTQAATLAIRYLRDKAPDRVIALVEAVKDAFAQPAAKRR